MLDAATQWTLLAVAAGSSLGLVGHLATWFRAATTRSIALGVGLGGLYALAYWDACGVARTYEHWLPSPYLASLAGGLALTAVLAAPALRWLRPHRPVTTPAVVAVTALVSAAAGVALIEAAIQFVLNW